MRLLFLVTLLGCLTPLIFAWTKEDYEIFDLVSALEDAEGPGTTFYSWLDIPPTASSAEIAKAYRKKSVTLHPDKNPNVKNIHERFARLGVVSTILRSPEDRERYDFFYKNGVPKWRGTGYYYSRFRPGLISVLVFLTILTAGLQHIVHRLNYNRDLARIKEFIRRARVAAWGVNMKQIPGRRKVRVHLPGNRDISGDEQEPVSGKMMEMIVDGDLVFLLDPSGEQFPIDESVPPKPTFSRIWPTALVLFLVRKLTAKKMEVETEGEESTEFEETGDDSSGVDSKPRNRVEVVKAGGRRRKPVKRR